MKETLRSVVAILAFTVVLGFGYTYLVTAISGWIWPEHASGSLLERDARVVGSELLAQPFSGPEYFWPRPSASGYNADSELGPSARALSYPSNLGPLNPDLVAAIREGVETYGDGVPIDLVTGSGSGLDPHISRASALWQVERVAHARGLDEDTVRRLIDDHVEAWWGRRYVNVLVLNLALDDLGS
jgi:K+-transporting ATPase ATPase C chain